MDSVPTEHQPMAAEVTPDQQQLVSVLLSSGRYPSEEAVLSEALELLHQRDRLRDMLADGVRQLDAGERIPASEALKSLRAGLPSAK